jgi:hypothetical protein
MTRREYYKALRDPKTGDEDGRPETVNQPTWSSLSDSLRAELKDQYLKRWTFEGSPREWVIDGWPYPPDSLKPDRVELDSAGKTGAYHSDNLTIDPDRDRLSKVYILVPPPYHELLRPGRGEITQTLQRPAVRSVARQQPRPDSHYWTPSISRRAVLVCQRCADVCDPTPNGNGVDTPCTGDPIGDAIRRERNPGL